MLLVSVGACGGRGVLQYTVGIVHAVMYDV
jgi:hypothetical protein